MKDMRVEAPNFSNAIETRSRNAKSRIILALDLDFREQASSILPEARRILKKTSKYLCAVKLNFHVILPLSMKELASLNRTISSLGLTSIADIKLNDIANTDRVASDYLWKAGFSAVIANPFVGYEEALEVVIKKARSIGKGVILLAYMSHKGADEGYGLELSDGRKLYELFLERARKWETDGVIVGSTKPEQIAIARRLLGDKIKIFSPGSGAQGGDPIRALRSGADYLIFGRKIIESKDPEESVKEIYLSQLLYSESR